MLKETGYQEKFVMLKPWLVEIIEVVKKDLKKEHFTIDKTFCKKYFLGKPMNHLQAEELAGAYEQEVAEGNIGLGEFIATRWLLKHTEIYGFFEENMKKLTPDFDELDLLSDEVSEKLISYSVKEFGPKKTYLFSVLNSVVYPEKYYKTLREEAEKETELNEKNRKMAEQAIMDASLKQRHEREMAALTNRYEKKLRGMQKKYLADTEMLKKQIRNLQQKL